jgi:hypothetical protein
MLLRFSDNQQLSEVEQIGYEKSIQMILDRAYSRSQVLASLENNFKMTLLRETAIKQLTNNWYITSRRLLHD